MTIADLGSLGEFISSIVVLATLIYLALQVRQNTSATRAASHHTITDALNQLNLRLAGDEEMTRIWKSGMEDRAALAELQRDRFDALMRAYLHVCDTMYYQASLGAGDHGLWQAEERYLGITMTTPGGRDWWAENSRSTSPAFCSAVQEIIQKYQPEIEKERVL